MKPYSVEDAEADLRTAIDSGDLERIDAASAVVDRLDQSAPPATLHQAALWYASMGLRVFPLSPSSKIPFKGSNGCLDATTDPEQINRWWTERPDSNIGIATGHLVDVVDIDGFEGQASRAKNWDDIFAKVDADNVGKTLTPRKGGMHIFVRATGDPNSTNIVPSVDYRGVGGYVVAPPSHTEDGKYRWLGEPRFSELGVS